MPMPLLSAYTEMLPRLQAEESLRRISELHAATPEVAQRDRERIINRWRKQAAPEQETVKLSPDELAVRLALAGIGVKKVKQT